MKKRKLVENILFIVVFVLVVLYPYIASLFGIQNDLVGAEEKVELSFEKLDDYIVQNFPGRAFLIKTKNQLLYSLFDVSPNATITKIGDTLFSTEALNYYHHGCHEVSEDDVNELVTKFRWFNEICKAKNKKMAILLTPTKPRYYSGPLSFADDIMLAYKDKEHILPYDIIKKHLQKSGLKYFDFIEQIDNNKNKYIEGKVPLFYKSGHHWSTYKSNLLGLDLNKYMRKELDLTIPHISIKASPSEIPIPPDADLFEVLNIYDKPNEKFYQSVINYDSVDFENLNYVISGGSFLGGLLLPYSTISITGDTYHIENKNLHCHKYVDNFAFESYDELNEKHDLLNFIKKADVFIFEINEINVYNATFGFLDYMLDHLEEI